MTVFTTFSIPLLQLLFFFVEVRSFSDVAVLSLPYLISKQCVLEQSAISQNLSKMQLSPPVQPSVQTLWLVIMCATMFANIARIRYIHGYTYNILYHAL